MDLILSIEEARRSRRMSQAEIARAFEITQGHYSKVARGEAPLSSALEERMRVWLSDNRSPEIGDVSTKRIRELVLSIRRECMELMHLMAINKGGAHED